MKKSHAAMLVVFFLAIPLTLYLGSIMTGRSYYLTGTLIVMELMIPFFMSFEGNRPQARGLVITAVMCALAIVARVAIPIPHFKAIFAVVMLAGIGLGPETGFVVGAVAAFVSNFYYGQGAYTPWQMMAYGAGGMLAGFSFAKGRLPQKPVMMAVFGFFAVILWVGPLLDLSSVFMMLTTYTFQAVMSIFISGFQVNVSQAVCTVLVMLLFGKPMLNILNRIKLKFGLMEDENGI